MNAGGRFAVTHGQEDGQEPSGVGGHQGPSGPPAEPTGTSENPPEETNISAEEQAEPTARQ